MVHFLDVALNLENGTYSPYRKPNDHLIYIHKDISQGDKRNAKIHQQRTLRHLGQQRGIQPLLAWLLEGPLDNGGHTKNLTFEDTTHQQQKPKKQNRSRNITWFNPPWNSAVTINIGACFLKLVDKHFKKDTPLHKILNRNTIKVWYSCIKNIKAIIKSHNSKILNGPPKER